MEECQSKREYYEKILANELNEEIDGVALNQLTIDEQVIKVKIFTFFYEDQKPVLEFMLNHRKDLFTNDQGLKLLNSLRNGKIVLELVQCI